MGLNEWTITPISSNSGNVFTLGGDGYLNFNYAADGNGGRPVLYLKASVAYAGGSGTKDSPITLVVWQILVKRGWWGYPPRAAEL